MHINQLPTQRAPESILCTASQHAHHQAPWCACFTPDLHSTPFLVGQSGYYLKPWKRSRHMAKSPQKVGSAGTSGGMDPKLQKTIPAFVNSPNSETLSFFKEMQGTPWLQEGLAFSRSSAQNAKCHKLACGIGVLMSFSKPTLTMV